MLTTAQPAQAPITPGRAPHHHISQEFDRSDPESDTYKMSSPSLAVGGVCSHTENTPYVAVTHYLSHRASIVSRGTELGLALRGV